MEIYEHLQQREAAGHPIRVGLVGCGQMGSGLVHVMNQIVGMEPMAIADVEVDTARREVTVAGERVELRTKEFDLLLAFAENPGIVLSRDQLLNLAWGYDFYGQTRTVDVHVAHVRKRLAASETVRIETVTGVGYKLVV
jgi:DNA-binding response OmpR family regulator